MKITTLILFLAIMQVSATTLAQKVSIKASNQPLSAVFDQISTQTGYDFAYTTKTLENAKPVTINVKNEELNQVLKQIFEGQPLEFTIKDRFVTVTVKQPTLLDKIKSAVGLDKIDVTGKIVDENNQPLPGATILVKGTNNSTTTDAKGIFNLTKVESNAIIVITFIGYEKKEINAAVDIGNIQLKQSSSQLDAVQIIAYGETSQRLNVGNVTTITSKDIEKQPVADPLLALEGRVPGLNIVQSNGIPGSAVTVRIQGQNSINNGNDPLIIVDGVPYETNIVGAGGGASAGFSPLSLINPDDIESISVLKDADATSIYGSRAANGAIIISTKKGKIGDTRVNVNLQNGFGHVTRELNLLNTKQYLQMRHEAITNDGMAVDPISDIDVNGTFDTTRYTDWQKQLIGGTAHYTDLNASVSGGTENTQFLVGSTYHRETTVFPGDFDDKKGNVHFSLSTRSANKKFKFQISASYLFDDNHLPAEDLTNYALTLAPNAPSLYNPDGSPNWALDNNGNSTWDAITSFHYPLQGTLQPYTSHAANLISSMLVSYSILPGLDVKTSFGYTNQQLNTTSLIPITSVEPASRPYFTRSSNFNKNSNDTWIIEPQVTYTKTINKGKLDVLVGGTIQQRSASTDFTNAYGYSSDLLLSNLSAASGYSVTSSDVLYKYDALFGRISYNWADKYLLDLNARRDGSSRFGPENEFHNFGSLAAGWIFSNESVIKNGLTFLSFGKLKASYGVTGSDQIGDYGFLSLYNVGNSAIPYQGIKGLVASNLTNPYLQWESTRKLNIGIDLGFINDRILFNINYSNNKSSNQLLTYALPLLTGFNYINYNFPATVQNTDVEFTLNTVNIKSTSFRWSSSFNLTIPRNKLLSFPDLATSSFADRLQIGQPLSIQKVYHSAGVNPQTGLYQFVAADGNLTSMPNFPTDKYLNINVDPKFYGGFDNTFTYKDFSLTVFFQFKKQKGYGFEPSYPGNLQFGGNVPVAVFNGRWQKPGDHATVQRFSTDFRYFDQIDAENSSDAFYTDASYIRLKNVSFSWLLKNAWANAIGSKSCRLFLQAQNLLTFTSYTGPDPESPNSFGSTQLPPLRVITFGINATF